MAFAGKHQFGEISDTRVTIVEKAISNERVDFLKDLLEFNGFTVLVEQNKKKNEEDPDTFDLGVTDIVFNPTIWVYDRKLKTRDGRIVSPDYWLQKTEKTKPQYWESMWK
ncbi:MAG: hypothetical protein R2771_15235 [Saprospiraceae bacterium]